MSKRSIIAIFTIGMFILGVAASAEAPHAASDVPATAVPSAPHAVVPSCLTIHNCLGCSTPDWPSTHGTQNDRLYRDGVASTCASPKSCPGPYESSGTRYWDAFAFTNTTGSPQCSEIDLTSYCSDWVHLVVYAGSYDPNDLCLNYLADSGSSSGSGDPRGLSVTVAPGQTILAVVHNVYPGNCVESAYTLTVTNLCNPFTNSFYDDVSRSEFCVNAKTGAYQWMILSGLGAGSTFTGTAQVLNGGAKFTSYPGAINTLNFTFDKLRKKAQGYFIAASAPPVKAETAWQPIYSPLVDKNTADDPAGCNPPPPASPILN